MRELDPPDQADTAGDCQDHVRQHRQVRRRYMDVNDPEGVALLVVNRREEQAGIDAIGNQDQPRDH